MQVDLVIFMEVVMLDYKVTSIEKKDENKIYKLLASEINDSKLIIRIRQHIRKGIAYKMIVGTEIKAIFMAMDFNTHYSLSYYFVKEDVRKKMPSLFFFLHCINKIKDKPIYIKANKNLSDYERYFVPTTEKNIYKFKGLREDARWAELLKL